MQTQATPPAVVNPAAMKAAHQIATKRNLPLQVTSPAITSELSQQVHPMAASTKPCPVECTHEQLIEIVVGVARGFRSAKEILVEHKDYILRLKKDVFKVPYRDVLNVTDEEPSRHLKM